MTDDRTTEPRRDGWMAEKPTAQKRYHYIVNTRALCGKYGFYQGLLMAPKDGATARGAEDCAECFKRLKRWKP